MLFTGNGLDASDSDVDGNSSESEGDSQSNDSNDQLQFQKASALRKGKLPRKPEPSSSKPDQVIIDPSHFTSTNALPTNALPSSAQNWRWDFHQHALAWVFQS